MLQLSNLDDGKSEWNINETHIIIPLVDTEVVANKETDKVSKNTITLNTLDGTDQAILTNAVEHTLVIGLDRNLFETYNNKGELVVIQNSDLKILPSSTDQKNSISYTLSFIDQSKNDVLWENTTLRSKSDWSSPEKQIDEVKDLLSYNEPSKNWDNCQVEKDSHQVILDGIHGIDVTQHSPNETVLSQQQKSLQKDSQFIMGYYPTVQNCEDIIPTSVISVPKSNDSIKVQRTVLVNAIDVEESLNQILIESNNSKWIKSDTSDVLVNEVDNESLTPSTILKSKEMSSILKMNHESKIVPNALLEKLKPVISPNGSETTRDQIINDVRSTKNSSLPEKSLPLKKKAKMKRTALAATNSQSPDNSTTSMKDSLQSSSDLQLPFASSKCQRPVSPFEDIDNNMSDSDSDEPLSNRLAKKTRIRSYNFKKKKQQTQENSLELALLKRKSAQMNKNKKVRLHASDNDESQNSKEYMSFDLRNETLADLDGFSSIHDVVNELAKKKYINTAVMDILFAGLSQMQVDIFKEIMSKRKSTTSCEHSTHLKAFALMVYFKQPAAFTYLKSIFRNGWPSVAAIKDWKRQLNSSKRLNHTGSTSDGQGERTS